MRTWSNYKKTFSAPNIFDFARSGDLASLAELLTQNPHTDLSQKNHKGYSALMLAIYNGQEVFAEALLRAGAEVNSTDNVGNTILMGAAFKGNLKLINLLLDYGADLNQLNDSGMSAYDWAKIFGRNEVMKLFELKGGINRKHSSLLKNYLNFAKLMIKAISLSK